MDNKKIPTILRIIIIVIIAITVGMLVWKIEENQPEPEHQIQKNNNPKQNYENITLYKNAIYGYKIEIPYDFEIKTGSMENPDSLINFISKKDNTPLFSIYAETSKFKNINTWLSDYQKKLSQMTSYEGVKINPPTIISKEKIYINEVEAIKIYLNNMPYSNYLTAIIKDNFLYTISYNGLLLENERSLLKENSNNQENIRTEFQLKHQVELNKIIESFKFIDNKN